MSFLGSIGYVMSQSGLAEALSTVYPEEVIKKIMKGKYYERAMRAHMLTSSVLKGMLLEKLDEEDKYILKLKLQACSSLLLRKTTALWTSQV